MAEDPRKRALIDAVLKRKALEKQMNEQIRTEWGRKNYETKIKNLKRGPGTKLYV